jgi:hypothetical protein
MAVTDYTVRGNGAICGIATLIVTMDEDDGTIVYNGYITSGIREPAIGDALMMNGEIMLISSVNPGTVAVARGCADTIPRQHAINSLVWFLYPTGTGNDKFEYADGETIAVKVLMNTSRGQLAIQDSPPNELTMNARFARPYPPGKVTVNGLPWFKPTAITTVALGMTIDWAHRDRLTQGDVLVDQQGDSIGPEIDAGYILRVFNGSDMLLRTEEILYGTQAGVPSTDGTTQSSFFYGMDLALTDFGIAPGDSGGPVPGYITLASKRATFESWTHYRIDFTIDAALIPTRGWGEVWGYAWGG